MNTVRSLAAPMLQLIIERIILHSSWLLSTLSPWLLFYFCDRHLVSQLGNISSLCKETKNMHFYSILHTVELTWSMFESWGGCSLVSVHLWRYRGGYPALTEVMNKLRQNKVNAAVSVITSVSPKFCRNTNVSDLFVLLEIPGLQEREGKDAAVS